MTQLCLASRDWDRLLLNALDYPDRLSIGYAFDLRHLFQRRLEQELRLLGFSLRTAPKNNLHRRNSRTLEGAPFIDSLGASTDAKFCLRYGIDDYSFGALNYRNNAKKCHDAGRFLSSAPLVLGNFGVCINSPPTSLFIHLPPELEVAGMVEVESGNRSSVQVWLGVRYRRDECNPSVVNELCGHLLDMPVTGAVEPLTYAYGSEFLRHFAGGKYDLSPDEDAELRARLGYPKKGKPIREQILYESACSIFGGEKVVRNYRGKELERLELDIWIPSKKLAFEYQGQQHSKRLPHWQAEENFESQLTRDSTKIEICKRLGIKLLHFGPNDDLKTKSVITFLRNRGIL